MIAIFPEIVTCAGARDVEKLAVLVRRYFGGGETYAPRPDITALLERSGLKVECLAMQGHGALLATDQKGRFAITAIVATGLDPLAQRFLLAHMLGHYLFDVQPLIAGGDWQISGYRESVCPMRRYGGESEPLAPGALEKRELLADQFAAALLMPLGMVRRAFAKLKDEANTAEFFGVHRSCLLRRLRELELVGNTPVNFLDAEQRLDNHEAADTAREGESTVLHAPVEPSTTRSFAASTYGNMERSTRQKSSPPQSETVSSPQDMQGLKGLERIRALARKIEREKS